MSQKQDWGRKETVVWPPHSPIYTFMGVAGCVLLTLVMCWLYLRFWQTPMQQTYTVAYAQSSIGTVFKQKGKYQLIYVAGGKVAPRLAVPLDFTEGETVLPGDRTVPVQLSEASKHQGHTFFFTGAPREYNDAALSRWLRQQSPTQRQDYGIGF